jgi:uncharacterized membrane-anchored protein
MKRKRLIVFIALVALQVLIAGNMARGRQVILMSGERVTLATRPIDPRDLFRGDYVVLDYEISTINTSEIPWNAAIAGVGQTVWVELDTADRIALPVTVSDFGPAPDAASMRGTVVRASGHAVTIEYGIEEYFVPEGTGWEVEWAREVDVVVAIDNNGTAVIDFLILDGQQWQSRDG